MTERRDWLNWRKQGVGASDVAGIVGISPWSSPYSVWATKVGLVESWDDSEILEAGRWLELAIGPWFADRIGLWVVGEQTQCEHPEDAIARATVDGFVVESPSEPAAPLGLLEIKTSGPGKEWDTIPEHYQAQAQWQMYVTKMERVWLAVLMGRRLDIHVLERDDKDIDYMVERVHEFWERFVVTGDPPPVDGSEATLDTLKEMHAETDVGAVVDLTDQAKALESLRAAKALAKLAKAKTNEAQAQLLELIGDAEFAVFDGERVLSLKSQTKSGFDSKRFAKDHPRLTKQYRTETTFRVLRDNGKDA